MPPKPKHKQIGKNITKRAKCTVKGCKNDISCGWSMTVEGEESKFYVVCYEHLSKHHDENDSFNFYDEFEIAGLETSVKLDRFGFEIPHDTEFFRDYLSKYVEKDNKSSIKRLKEWKEKNSNKKQKTKSRPKHKLKKIKVKPLPTISTLRTKKVSNSEIDDILSGIIGKKGK